MRRLVTGTPTKFGRVGFEVSLPASTPVTSVCRIEPDRQFVRVDRFGPLLVFGHLVGFIDQAGGATLGFSRSFAASLSVGAAGSDSHAPACSRRNSTTPVRCAHPTSPARQRVSSSDDS